MDPFGLCRDESSWEKFKSGYYFGTGYGDEAVEWWANQWVETGNPLYAVGGGFATLWTSDTWFDTTMALGGGEVAGAAFKWGGKWLAQGTRWASNRLVVTAERLLAKGGQQAAKGTLKTAENPLTNEIRGRFFLECRKNVTDDLSDLNRQTNCSSLKSNGGGITFEV